MTFSYDNNVLASRGEDGFLKLWDMRNTKTVMASRNQFTTVIRELFFRNIGNFVDIQGC